VGAAEEWFAPVNLPILGWISLRPLGGLPISKPQGKGQFNELRPQLYDDWWEGGRRDSGGARHQSGHRRSFRADALSQPPTARCGCRVGKGRFSGLERASVRRAKEIRLPNRAKLSEHKEALISLLTREQGKPRQVAEWELSASILWCDEIGQQEIPVDLVEQTSARTIETRRTPIGVVGGITPWNYPVISAIWKIAPALIVGNTMVLKPSPFTPLTTLKIGEMLRGVLPTGS
jgi:Aldehyde dehydrogenase family